MTIEEIKEIRATVLPTEQEYFDAHSVEMVDTLLAEVEQWKDEYQKVNVVRNEQDTKLTIATEALERIVSATTQRITTARYVARTALERIKE